MATIASIVYKPADLADTTDAYLRVGMNDANLIAGKGIEGDRKGGGRNRHLNIMSAETLMKLVAHGYATGPGQMGEQLVIADLDVDGLPLKTHLKLGQGAEIEVFELRTPCGRFECVQEGATGDAGVPLGMMARVVKGGKIRVGDEVSVVK